MHVQCVEEPMQVKISQIAISTLLPDIFQVGQLLRIAAGVLYFRLSFSSCRGKPGEWGNLGTCA
jgi:hypothetical protein